MPYHAWYKLSWPYQCYRVYPHRVWRSVPGILLRIGADACGYDITVTTAIQCRSGAVLTTKLYHRRHKMIKQHLLQMVIHPIAITINDIWNNYRINSSTGTDHCHMHLRRQHIRYYQDYQRQKGSQDYFFHFTVLCLCYKNRDFLLVKTKG